MRCRDREVDGFLCCEARVGRRGGTLEIVIDSIVELGESRWERIPMYFEGFVFIFFFIWPLTGKGKYAVHCLLQ